MDTIRKTLIAASLVLISASAQAAGLGKLKVFSALGQPFRAEIELVAVSKEESLTLSAKLAPPEAFNQANIEYSSSLLGIKFAVEKRAEGEPQILKLSSSQPVNEPFLDMLVELNWAGGRLVREYTLLLDPPGYQPSAAPVPAAPSAAATPAPQPVESQPLAAPAEPAKAPAETAKPESRPATAAEEKPAAKAQPKPAATTYEVKRGDTLRRIADQNSIDGITMDQMLIALYRNNRDAFVGNNINRLRAGAILTIPDRDEALATGEADARRLVMAQASDFNAYRKKLAGAVEAAPAAKEAPAAQTAKGKITAQVEDKAAAAKAGQDQLKLSRADEKGKAATDAKGAAAAKADDKAAKEKAIKEANSRAAELEKNTQDLKKLIDIKNQQMAELQAKSAAKAAETKGPALKAAETKAAEPKAPEPKAAEPKAAPAKAEEAKAAPAPAKQEGAKAAPAPAKQEEAKPAEVKAPETKAAPAPADAKPAEAKAEAKKADAKAAPRKAAPPEPDLLDQAMDVAPYLGGLLLLAGAAYGFFAYRRRKSISKFEDSIITGGDLKANSVFANTGGQSVDTGSSSLQSVVSESGGGAADSDEVDPIAEADVYMAYGRDSQAEEILKEALAKDSGRQAIRSKLLEIYFARKDARTFETIAGELYAATGGSGPEWSKAVEMGVQLDPNNTLYGGQAAHAAPRPASPEDTVVLPGQMPSDTIIMASKAEEAAAAPAVPEEIIDLSAPVESEAAAPAEAPASDLDFDLDLGDGAPKAPTDVSFDAAPEAAPSAEAPSIDFDLGGAGAAAPAAPAPTPESSAIDFKAPTAPSAEFNPSATVAMAHAPDLEEFDPTATVAMTDSARKSAPPEAPPPKAKAPAREVPLKLPDEGAMLDDGAFDHEKTIVVDFNMPLDAPAADQHAPGNGGGAHDARWQEVATKLDLAKAYEEMCDKDGTRELLNEVLKEGDNAQQDQARGILARLG